MKITPEDLRREASATGFSAEALEKAMRLLALLDGVRSHPFLGPRMALKGGTALNLFVFDMPRLSVDIDLNYVGPADRSTMLSERPRVEQAAQDVCQREGLVVKRVPSDHAGGKWRLSYAAASGGTGNLEIDVNFLLRTPLWPAVPVDSRPVGTYRSTQTRLLDLHELAGGKLAALLARTASRDVFDARGLLALHSVDPIKLRLAFVAYGAANRKDWRTASVDDVKLDVAEVQAQLVPMLRGGEAPDRRSVAAWSEQMLAECRERLALVLPLSGEEHAFVERLNDHGEIRPELVTDDARLQAVIRDHPALRWKALNVRKHRGLPTPDEP